MMQIFDNSPKNIGFVQHLIAAKYWTEIAFGVSIITGPPTHSVGWGGSIVFLSGICRRRNL